MNEKISEALEEFAREYEVVGYIPANSQALRTISDELCRKMEEERITIPAWANINGEQAQKDIERNRTIDTMQSLIRKELGGGE